jgi:glycosyltransferase involved in cell wall biosynthesis
LEKKPNLVFVATRVPYPAVTGHYLRTLNILRGLADHFSVHLFAFRDKNRSPAEHALADRALEQVCSTVHTEAVGAEVSRLRLLADIVSSLLTFRPFTAAKYRSRTMRRAIHDALASRDVIFVHADSLPSGQYLDGLAQPKLITNHNVEYQRLRSHAAQQRQAMYRVALRIQAWLTRRYEKKLLSSIGNCVAVSETDRTELSRLSPGARFFVVRNGADTSSPPLPPADTPAHVALWVGGMDDPFNREGVLHFALHILPKVRHALPGFRWCVVGRDPPEALRLLANAPSSGVELGGFVPDLRGAYERSAIVVVPLISGGGTKLKVLEAMAMGRAVVTTPVGAEGIGARAGIEMEIAASDEEFAEKVCSLLRDPERRNRMAAAARSLAERDFGWDVVNRQMLAAVTSVIRSDTRDAAAAPCVE